MEIIFEQVKDKNKIPALLDLCRAAGRASNGSSWNDAYPNSEILSRDIDVGQLFEIYADGECAGIICMGEEEEELVGLPWQHPAHHASEFSRFCLAADKQGKGLARPVLEAAFSHARACGYDAAHILVTTCHEQALALYKKIGFVCLGEAHLWDEDFYFCEYAL